MAKRRTIREFIGDAFGVPGGKESGLTRGGEGDVYSLQRYSAGRELGTEECNALYEENWLAGNVVDTLAEDLVQAGWKFLCPDDEELQTGIENDWLNLRLKAVLFDMVRYTLIEGDGYVGLGLREGSSPDLASPVKAVRGIDYIHAFRRSSVSKQERNKDPLSSDFGSWHLYTVKAGADGNTDTIVHSDRILHLQLFPSSMRVWGNSVFRRLFDVVQVADNALWSVGQAVYQLVFKVLKVDYDQFTAKAKEMSLSPRDLMMRWAYDLNSLTMFVLDKGTADVKADELELPGLSGSLTAIPSVRDFILMVLSAATRIPQSRLVGNEQGKLSGAEWDVQNYFARIRALQELHIQPLIEKVTDYLLRARGKDPALVEYSIEFRPLYVETDQMIATTEKTQAETDAIYIMNDVLTPDEIRERRFHLAGLMGEVGTTEAPEEIETVVESPDLADV